MSDKFWVIWEYKSEEPNYVDIYFSFEKVKEDIAWYRKKEPDLRY